VLGKAAARLFESFYGCTDPALRVVAAKMASQWSHHERIFDQHASKMLLAVAADESAPEFSRADATLYLSEMGEEGARPYAESILQHAKNSAAQEFALRALIRVGTRSSESALFNALNEPILVNQFLATYALQRIECGTSLDETQCRRRPEKVIDAWRAYTNRSLKRPPCDAVPR